MRILKKNILGNKKGYLTIEIILASVIAFAIAFFLIEITMKLVNTTDDYYLDTVLVTDKSLIIKNIKEKIQDDINLHGLISYVSCTEDNKCHIAYSGRGWLISSDYGNYYAIGGSIERILEITSDNKIKYYSVNEDDSENIVYSKELNENLSNIKLKFMIKDNLLYRFVIETENIFSNSDYSMTIPILNACTRVPDNKKIVNFNWIDGENGQQNDYGYISTHYNNVRIYGFYDSVYDDTQDISCTNGMTVSSANQSGGGWLDIYFDNASSDTECTIPTRELNTYSINITVHYGNESEEKLILEARENQCCNSITISKKSGYSKYERYECTNTNNGETYFRLYDYTSSTYFSVSYPKENFDCDIYFTS